MEENKYEKESHQKVLILGFGLIFAIFILLLVVITNLIGDLRKDIEAEDAKIEEIAEQQNILVSTLDALRHPVSDSQQNNTSSEKPALSTPDVPAIETTTPSANESQPMIITPPPAPEAPQKP